MGLCSFEDPYPKSGNLKAYLKVRHAQYLATYPCVPKYNQGCYYLHIILVEQELLPLFDIMGVVYYR